MLSSSHTKRAKLNKAPSLEQEVSGREAREISTFSFPYPEIAEDQILQPTALTSRKSSEENSPQLALLALEVPCAMPMCPARHNDVPECGEIGRWHNLEQFYCRRPVCAIEEANIGVLQPSENLQG